jgi:hypothetical protein
MYICFGWRWKGLARGCGLVGVEDLYIHLRWELEGGLEECLTISGRLTWGAEERMGYLIPSQISARNY